MAYYPYITPVTPSYLEHCVINIYNNVKTETTIIMRVTVLKLNSLVLQCSYHIYLAIRRGSSLSRMTTNN